MMDAPLLQEFARLRALTAHQNARLEAERKWLAQEIHDELGQLLNALHVHTSQLALQLEPVHPALLPTTAAMDGLIQRALSVMRQIVGRVRPPALNEGLACALEWLVADVRETAGLPCSLHVEDVLLDLPEAVELALFRVAQEALTNCSRHAQAQQVQVMLCRQQGVAVLQIVDDGTGFDPHRPARPDAMGLSGMRERMQAVGGKLTIMSEPGRGTCVSASLPVESSDR